MSGAIVDRDALLAWAGEARGRGETIAFAFRAFEIADMTDVQEIEAAVGERDRQAAGAIVADALGQSGAIEDLTHY